MKLSIIIPVYNEAETISNIIERVKRADINLMKEIIIVDDCSTDGTPNILQGLDDQEIKIIYHARNLGKGAALRTGLKHITGDIVIFQDADLEYDPRDYSSLIEPIKDKFADVVYGSRLSGGRPQRVYMFWHKAGNKLITLTANILFNNTLSDIETGYKVFTRNAIQSLNLKSNDFSIEPEITAKVFKKGYKVYEIPISYYGRTYKEGKKITWIYGFSAIWTLLKYRFID